jgi:hypothetical protein
MMIWTVFSNPFANSSKFERIARPLFLGFGFVESVAKTTALSSPALPVQVFRAGLLRNVGMVFGFLFENGLS